jgi:hypothetical protein
MEQMTAPNPDELEQVSLKLVADMQAELAHALNSLGGKKTNGLVERFQFFPGPLNEAKLRVEETAKAGGKEMEGYYNSHYRFYCRYTHAALEAIMGNFDAQSGEDNIAMAGCVFCGLGALGDFGAEAPNVHSLASRLSNISR